MKTLSKYTLPNTFQYNLKEKDENGVTKMFLEPKVIFKIQNQSVILNSSDKELAFIENNSDLTALVKNTEELVIKDLFDKSIELFGKQFSLEKFQKNLESNLEQNNDDSRFFLHTKNTNSSCRLLNSFGDELEIESDKKYTGEIVIMLDFVQFYNSSFSLQWKVNLFIENDMEEVEEKKSEDPCKEIINEEIEDNTPFF